MKKIQRIELICLGFLLSACIGAKLPAAFPLSATPRVDENIKTLPTALPPADSISNKDLQVAMDCTEITAAYMTEYGSTREPPAQQKFLWVHVLLSNTGDLERSLPAAEHFSVIYGRSEFKPTYGHRRDFSDYSTIKTIVYPGQIVNAWLRFDIPAAAGLQDMQAAFLPESSQISFSSPASGYPWAEHPLYLWRCGP
jgi:hypothetical protein